MELKYGDKIIRMEGVIVEVHDGCVGVDLKGRLGYLKIPMRMLITDYSSVCWDVLYQDKPILFYQFDLDKYEEAQGSYLNMRTELFGDRAENCDELLDKLEEQIKNDFHMKPEYEAMRKRYFRSTDHTHSRQICECIKNLL